MVLRCPRQRTVRPDHRTAGVLSRPGPNAPCSPRSPTTSPPSPARTCSSNWARGRRKRPCCCCGRCWRRAACAPTSPQDVSPSALIAASEQLGSLFPDLVVRGIVSDFTDTLHNLPRGEHRMVAFLGGTLGNLVPAERAEFLTSVREVLHPGEGLLLGVGLVIDPSVLVPAYDDAAGVTAEFNRNVLQRAQPPPRRRLRTRPVPPRRVVGRRERVDRDAARGHRRR